MEAMNVLLPTKENIRASKPRDKVTSLKVELDVLIKKLKQHVRLLKSIKIH